MFHIQGVEQLPAFQLVQITDDFRQISRVEIMPISQQESAIAWMVTPHQLHILPGNAFLLDAMGKEMR